MSPLATEVVDSCAEDDTGAVGWIMRGTHEGDVMGIEPTDKQIEVEGMEFNRVEDGKIVETHINYDALGML